MTISPQFPCLDQSHALDIFSNGCLDLSANILTSDMVLVWDVQLPSVASHLKRLRPVF